MTIDIGSFAHTQYLLRRQVLKLFGGTFRIYGPTGSLALLADMKAFKLKEDIRVYTEEAKTNEVLTIKARSIIDFSAAYDVMDPQSGEKLGAFRRRGMKSIIKDEWIILDKMDNEIGTIKEDSWGLAILRRVLGDLSAIIPQKLLGEVGGTPVLEFKQNFNPFVYKLNLDFSPDIRGALDRRMGIAAAVLLCGIEGKQQG